MPTVHDVAISYLHRPVKPTSQYSENGSSNLLYCSQVLETRWRQNWVPRSCGLRLGWSVLCLTQHLFRKIASIAHYFLKGLSSCLLNRFLPTARNFIVAWKTKARCHGLQKSLELTDGRCKQGRKDNDFLEDQTICPDWLVRIPSRSGLHDSFVSLAIVI